jgi:hypothetical protein
MAIFNSYVKLPEGIFWDLPKRDLIRAGIPSCLRVSAHVLKVFESETSYGAFNIEFTIVYISVLCFLVPILQRGYFSAWEGSGFGSGLPLWLCGSPRVATLLWRWFGSIKMPQTATCIGCMCFFLRHCWFSPFFTPFSRHDVTIWDCEVCWPGPERWRGPECKEFETIRGTGCNG